MQRFFLENCKFNNSFILDDKELVHQIWVVLRSRIWDYFIFFDWVNSVDKIYRLSLISKNALEFKFVEDVEKDVEKWSMNLFQAIPNKLEKLEYIVQKWTEIWYNKFIFFRWERSQKLDLQWKRQERLKKIIIESTEQSWRNIVPELYFMDKLDFWLLDKKETLFFHTNNENSKKLNDIKTWRNINLLIWPEWWWSDIELAKFEELWFEKVFLWNNILRCETVSSVVWFYIFQNKISK